MIDTLAIVRPPVTGDQELALRLFTGFEDTSLSVAMYSSPELFNLDANDLSKTTLLVVSPGQCVQASGDQGAFLSTLASAQKRILASADPVDGQGYQRRLNKGICFDAVLDIGFVSQQRSHSDVSDVPYHFVFNGLTRGEQRLATELARSEERTIPWVLVGAKNHRNRDLLAELLENKVDPRGLCFLHTSLQSKTAAQPMLSSSGLSSILSRARFCLWSSDRGVAYYESSRFIRALLAGAVPCKIDSAYHKEGFDIPGVYPTVSAFQTDVGDKGYCSMYRRASTFWLSRGQLGELLSEALDLV